MHRRIGILIAGLLILAAILCRWAEKEPESSISWPASERYRWPNPSGYGLPPETEEYNGVFF